MNLIVTAKVESGKTEWCTKYSRWLAARGLTVGGVLCPEVRSGYTRIGYDIVDIQTGRKAVFGRLVSKADFPGERVGNYVVSHAGLKFAELAIKEAVESGCNVVFIDEVGHLELAGRGLTKSANTAYRTAYNTVSVVRKSLLTAFLEHFRLEDPPIGFIIKDLESDTSYPFPGKEIRYRSMCK